MRIRCYEVLFNPSLGKYVTACSMNGISGQIFLRLTRYWKQPRRNWRTVSSVPNDSILGWHPPLASISHGCLCASPSTYLEITSIQLYPYITRRKVSPIYYHHVFISRPPDLDPKSTCEDVRTIRLYKRCNEIRYIV